jgi:hypothetical protein
MTSRARRRSRFRVIGNPLIRKLVKPIKVARSRFANQVYVDQLLVVQAETQMGTADTAVLWEANPAMARKLTGFDLANRCLDHSTKLTALFFRD